MSPTIVVPVDEPSRIGEARRAVTQPGRDAGLDATTMGRAALVATELASNLVHHAGGGRMLLRVLTDGAAIGLEVVAADRGPGMDVAVSMRDGHSTAGTRGVGLGAVRRASTVFDAFSRRDVGTFVLSQVFPGEGSGSIRTPGAVCVPHPAERVCGDSWSVHRSAGRTLVCVGDGLGHGPDAAAAVAVLDRIVAQELTRAPAEILASAHAALRTTRGAAVVIAAIDHAACELRYAGVGNVSGELVRPDGTTQGCVSQHGIVGAHSPRIRELSYAHPPGTTFVLCSDGLTSSARVGHTPQLAAHHPALVACALWSMHRRSNDDSTVIVLREIRA